MRNMLLFGALFAICAPVYSLAAQPSAGAMDERATAQATRTEIRTEVHANAQTLTAAERTEIKDVVSSARAEEKSIGVTREQIQAIRAALRAKLALLHH